MKEGLAKAIESCLEQILPDCYVRRPTRGRLKSGAIVYRIAGSQGIEIGRDGKIYYRNYPKDDVEVTRENLATVRDSGNYYFGNWEFFVLEKGQERVAAELRDALMALGYPVDVSVGGGRSDYQASIAVKPLAGPMADTFPDEIGELDAITDELTTISTAIIFLVARLRSLLVTVGKRADA